MKVVAVLLAGLALVGATVSPRVTRTTLVNFEKLADSKVVQVDARLPADVLGPTRAVYLDGYGVVFTAEVDLNPFAAPNPFRPKYSDAEIGKLRADKQARIETLKKRMVESLMVIAQGLEGVPPTEQVAMAVTIPYYIWEKSTGMPRQIVIRAPKSALTNPKDLEASLKVQEF